MRQHASFAVVQNLPESITIMDIGHDQGCLSVTNDAEHVVRRVKVVYGLGKNQRLFYYDSDGRKDELLHDSERFLGFGILEQ